MENTLQTLRARSISLIEQDIARNNELIMLAGRIEDPRMRSVALKEVGEHIERTRNILKKINHGS